MKITNEEFVGNFCMTCCIPKQLNNIIIMKFHVKYMQAHERNKSRSNILQIL